MKLNTRNHIGEGTLTTHENSIQDMFVTANGTHLLINGYWHEVLESIDIEDYTEIVEANGSKIEIDFEPDWEDED